MHNSFRVLVANSESVFASVPKNPDAVRIMSNFLPSVYAIADEALYKAPRTS